MTDQEGRGRGRPRLRIGEALVHAGLINQDQLRQAMALQGKGPRRRLGQVLVEMRVVTERDIAEILSAHLNVPYLDLANYIVEPALARLVPQHVSERHRLVPISKIGTKLTVAMEDPLDVLALDEVALMTGLQVKPVLATPTDLERALQDAYQGGNRIDQIIDEFHERSIEMVPDDLEAIEDFDADEGPVIRLVNLILTQAIQSGVSDIHVEPFEKYLRVRYRTDGVLHLAMTPTKRVHAALVSRIKIMAEMDIAEKRKAQDGRIQFHAAGRPIDLRVSVLPTSWGEKVVMRILDQSGLTVDLTKLGFEPMSYHRFIEGISNPHGIILVTGPTGSGKTTTLYSALTRLNSMEVNIMTAEDPVEYQLDGVNQVQAKEEIDMSFAHILRSFLRQDPDIIMVGEIRDEETASIAIKAALTGHLVLSTLHTNDAPSSISRLLDMSIPPYMITSSVELIQAQRLVRTLCKDCKMEYRPKPETVSSLKIDEALLGRLELPGIDPGTVRFFKGKGCESCGNSGHKGRLGIYEVMKMSEGIRQLVLRGGTNSDFSRLARAEGMLTLRESAVRKALLGLTTVEEVLRVTAEVD